MVIVTPQPLPLPPLREELELRSGPVAIDGTQTWLVYDPLQHRYVQIDRITFEVLSRWRSHATVESLASATSTATGLMFDEGEINALIRFLRSQRLLIADSESTWNELASVAGHQQSWLSQLAHHYLFFRMPLFAPEPLLRRMLPVVEPFFHVSTWMFFALIGLCGLYLALRQWDQFIASAHDLLNVEGATLFAITLFFVKIFHELGHAFTAVRFGCRVPTLGIAFMLLTPMLYTDVTDAWRLSNRRQRLMIDLAGVMAELALAAIATLTWAFLPIGPAKNVAFVIAATSWIMSLGVNLNPLMRFDGYYILADFLKIENLQARSFSFGTWKLKELLFNLRLPSPEMLSPRMTRFLIVFAWSIWVYRLVLFTGIALLVYTYFFKLLGLVLFLFEIIYFIAGPIAREAQTWWGARDRICASPRAAVSCAAAVCLSVVLFAPWSSTVSAPAIIEARELVRLYPVRVAMITAINVSAGDWVEPNASLVQLSAPEINQEKHLLAARLHRVRLRLSRRGSDDLDRDDSLVLEREQAALAVKAQGLAMEEAELTVRAPIGGYVVELNPELVVGRWIARNEPIATISAAGFAVRGYVSESGAARLRPGARGRFYPDDGRVIAYDVVLAEIASTTASTIEINELASQFGGAIPTQPDAQQRPVPMSAQYPVRFDVPNVELTPLRTLRGVVHISATKESIAAGFWRHILKILVRESGV